MKSYVYVNRLLLLTFFCMSALLGCSREENLIAASSLNLTTTPLGQVITGDAGKTLYFFAGDAAGTPTCTDTWSIFYQETPTFGSGLNSSDFGTLTRADGAKQTTFNSWPLYNFGPDQGVRVIQKG